MARRLVEPAPLLFLGNDFPPALLDLRSRLRGCSSSKEKPEFKQAGDKMNDADRADVLSQP
jgi:hypothetical protein